MSPPLMFVCVSRVLYGIPCAILIVSIRGGKVSCRRTVNAFSFPLDFACPSIGQIGYADRLKVCKLFTQSNNETASDVYALGTELRRRTKDADCLGWTRTDVSPLRCSPLE